MQGFANALSNRITHSGTIASIIDHLVGKKNEVIFPLYDPNVYRLFKLALIERYNTTQPDLLNDHIAFVDKPAGA
ncbi:MAG: hypothetical protein K2Q33_00905 [Gammaproteobacteria bacterium]|nr:hypothetical protein [Gammaproteobacteria bacterium]